MKQRIYFTCFLLSMLLTLVKGQNTIDSTTYLSDTISFVKKKSGYRLYQNNAELNLKHLKAIVRNNDAASKAISSARTSNVFANILGISAGSLIGYQVGKGIAGNKMNWTFIGIGRIIYSFSSHFSQFNKKC